VREGRRILEPFLADGARSRIEPRRVGALLGTVGLAYYRLGEVRKAIGLYEQQLGIVTEIGDRQGEGTALGNLGVVYAGLGEAEKARGLLEQALAIGRQIEDPEIVQVTAAALERLRSGGA